MESSHNEGTSIQPEHGTFGQARLDCCSCEAVVWKQCDWCETESQMCCHFMVMTHHFLCVRDEPLWPWNLKRQPNDCGQFDTWGWRICGVNVLARVSTASVMTVVIGWQCFLLECALLNKTWTERSLKSCLSWYDGKKINWNVLYILIVHMRIPIEKVCNSSMNWNE